MTCEHSTDTTRTSRSFTRSCPSVGAVGLAFVQPRRNRPAGPQRPAATRAVLFAGVCGVIDASSLFPQLQILAVQVRPAVCGDTRRITHCPEWLLLGCCARQVVLITQLVIQVGLVPFMDAKLCAVSDSRGISHAAAQLDVAAFVQVETVLTVVLVLLSLCGMVRDRLFPTRPICRRRPHVPRT